MLDLIASETAIKHLYNCEFVPEVYKKQVNKDISLIGGDALKLPFKEGVFDYVIIKNLLHHLVGRTRRESKELQKQGIKDIIRVTKNRGYVIIMEQYNTHKIFAFILFYLTLFLPSLRLQFKYFSIYKSVIVSFLTPNEIKDLLKSHDLKVVLSKANRLNMPLKFKITFLMSNVGRILFIGLKK